MYLRKGNCRIEKDKVDVITVLHSITNTPHWDFLRGTGVIIIGSVSMNSCVFILATDFPSVAQGKAQDSR